jgi:kinesin family protein 4/21/27
LAELQKDKKKLVEAQREHDRLTRQNFNYERIIDKLKNDVDFMKRTKVKLQIQLKTEGVKLRELEAKKGREISQLKKDQRKKDLQIKSLESKDKLKDQMLKRRHEEFSALKKKQALAQSKRVAGKVISTKKFSPVKAKESWGQLRVNISKEALMRSSIESREKEMLSHINHRAELLEEIETLNSIDANTSSTADINEINERLDTLLATLDYTEEQISMIQRDLIEIASNKDESGNSMATAINALNKDECGYVMQKMYEHTVEHIASAGAAARRLDAIEQDNVKLATETIVLRDLLMHLYSKNAADDPDLPPELAMHLENVRNGKSLGLGLPPVTTGTASTNTDK